MTSATERLRALLDERGVEWWQSVNMLGCVFTRWYSSLFGDEVVAMENGDGELELFSRIMTPEQAVEATLGRGTCHSANVTEYAWDDFECSECGWVTWNFVMDHEGCGTVQQPRYCPNCGRKVVE